MPIEESQRAHAILINKDEFVKLIRVTYPKIQGPPYIIHQARKPRFDGDMFDTTEFRLAVQISADQAQQRYGLLIRDHYVITYQEQ